VPKNAISEKQVFQKRFGFFSKNDRQNDDLARNGNVLDGIQTAALN
jgi:hypothetical protein